MSKSKLISIVGALIVAIAAVGAYAMTASNTVPGTSAGIGSGVISGYAATNIVYGFDSDPNKMDTISFTLDKPASTVKVQAVSGGTWYSCDNGGSGNNWTCDTTAPQLMTSAMDNLSVAATS